MVGSECLRLLRHTLSASGLDRGGPVCETLAPIKKGTGLSVSVTVDPAPPRGSSRRPGQPVAQVRGILAERVVISTELDPFLGLKALAAYSGISVRKLRQCLDDSVHPLPCYRVGGKILVRRGEFDVWVAAYRQRGRADVGQVVSSVLGDLRASP